MQAIGMEIGAVTVKCVSNAGKDTATARVVRHDGNPRQAVSELLQMVDDGARGVGTGCTTNFVDIPHRSELECVERALEHLGLRPDVLLTLGGETFTTYTLKSGRIRTFLSSSRCAAGSGEFILQQLERMGLSLEEGLQEAEKGQQVDLSSRCSVYCKSDATHKLNKGEYTRADIARSLITDLANKAIKQLNAIQWPTDEILVVGGVAQNAPFVRCLRSLLPHATIRVIDESPYLAAFGASLLAAELPALASSAPPSAWLKPPRMPFDVLEPLNLASSLVDYRADHSRPQTIRPKGEYLLCIDAGSTTTKAVLYNAEESSVDWSCYLRTLGNPVAATQSCLRLALEASRGKAIDIVQAAATGSGRELVSLYLDSCPTFNEILAHGRAAARACPSVETVIEIGGQDSKLISLNHGIPVDYEMNDGCSAGTGSFLEETVSVDMKVPYQEISTRALRAPSPISFGERCAAFINTDLRTALQQGAERDDIIAGLVASIGRNYVTRLVGPRPVGDSIVFQGGVALNEAVAHALAGLLQKKIIVPSTPELMGCVGTGLLLTEQMRTGRVPRKSLALARLIEGAIETKSSFRCRECDNRCEISMISVRGESHPFGGSCSKYELTRRRINQTQRGVDLVALRHRLMFEDFGPRPVKKPRGTIGVPLALTTYAFYPFYARLINELGFDLVLSRRQRMGVTRAAHAEMCYPCEMAHGAVLDLADQGVDYVFLPHMLSGPTPGDLRSTNTAILPNSHSSKLSIAQTCVTTGVMPDLMKAVAPSLKDKILDPYIGLSTDMQRATFIEIRRMAERLGLSRAAGQRAAERAFEHQLRFATTYRTQVLNELRKLEDDPKIVIVGKPYIVFAPESNLALPRKITQRGFHVVPYDALPDAPEYWHPRNIWTFGHGVDAAVAYAERTASTYICLLSTFLCAPDGVMFHDYQDKLRGKVFCYLEIDSHTAHTGFDTRIGALLDLVEQTSWSAGRVATGASPAGSTSQSAAS